MSSIERFISYLDSAKLDHKSYQAEGVRWMLNNEVNGNQMCKYRGGFIADEMGLGKTIMTIGVMLCNFLTRTLIVVPPILVEQWYSEIKRTTGHKALIYRGNITLDQLNKAPIVITTYGAVTIKRGSNGGSNGGKVLTMLHQLVWSRIVFDEAHHLRNAKTIKYASVRLLSSQIRWLISGTPIHNSIKDFYALCSILRLPPNFYKKTENLLSLAKTFILKRTKKQVGIILEDVVATKNTVTWLSNNEKSISEEIHGALKFSHVKPKINNIFIKKGCQALILMLRARQSCIYPNLLSKTLSGYSSSKLDYVVNRILERSNSGCGKLVFCQFRGEITEIASRLKRGGIHSVAILDGRCSSVKRTEILAQKNDVLILQIQTGCEGLNLQANYSEIYFVAPHWNPAIEDQAIARCHRIGQTKTVYVERFEMEGFNKIDQEVKPRSVDNYMESVQEGKRNLIGKLL
jgi:SNF2 family DNA or RNA helicase